MLLYVFIFFFGFCCCCCFSLKKFVFYIFVSFFNEVTKFPQQNINQSETGIGDKKLLLKLDDDQFDSSINGS